MIDDDKDEVIDLEKEGSEEVQVIDRGDDVVDPDTEDPGQPEVKDPISKDALEDIANDEPVVPEIKIPKSRFDEVNTRMKAAEAKLAEMEAAKAAEVQQAETSKSATLKAELAEKTKAYHQALIDGEFESVDKLALELDDVRERITEARAREIATKEIAETRAKDQQLSYAEKVNQRATEIADANPFLIDGSDPEAFELFELVRDGAIAKGSDNIAAMNKALSAVLKLRGDAPPPAPEIPKPNTLQKKIAAAKAQPPRPIGVGNRAAGSTTPTRVSEMSEEDFAKVPEAERKRLRGDFI